MWPSLWARLTAASHSQGLATLDVAVGLGVQGLGLSSIERQGAHPLWGQQGIAVCVAVASNGRGSLFNSGKPPRQHVQAVGTVG